VIYLDTSVVLSQLLAEDIRPPERIWDETLVSSRLMAYEVWTRINARNLAGSHGDAATALIGRTSLLELSPPVLARVLEPFPVPVRTVDAIHLASLDFLLRNAQITQLATYDSRMRLAAEAMGFELADLAS
jgi:hypothetical protein